MVPEHLADDRSFDISGNHSGAEMAIMPIAALPEIVRLCEKQAPLFIASIPKAGKLHLRLQPVET